MRSSLQDLAGEAARLRAECSHLLRVLDDLNHMSNHRSHLSNAQEDDIASANHTYSWSAKQNLEHATDDLKNWRDALDSILRQPTTHLGY